MRSRSSSERDARPDASVAERQRAGERALSRSSRYANSSASHHSGSQPQPWKVATGSSSSSRKRASDAERCCAGPQPLLEVVEQEAAAPQRRAQPRSPTPPRTPRAERRDRREVAPAARAAPGREERREARRGRVDARPGSTNGPFLSSASASPAWASGRPGASATAARNSSSASSRSPACELRVAVLDEPQADRCPGSGRCAPSGRAGSRAARARLRPWSPAPSAADVVRPELLERPRDGGRPRPLRGGAPAGGAGEPASRAEREGRVHAPPRAFLST